MERQQTTTRPLTLALVGMACALDLPFYLVLTHLPWSIFPAWLLPALLVASTASGVVAARAQESRTQWTLGSASRVQIFAVVVPVLLALAGGYLGSTLWVGLYPLSTNWLASYFLLLLCGLLAGVTPLLLFVGRRSAMLVLCFHGLVACVLLSIPGTPLYPWSLVPIEVPSPVVVALLGTVSILTLVVSSRREQNLSWQRRRVKVMPDAPAIATAGGLSVAVVVIVALLAPLLLPLVLPQSRTLEAFWQQHDPLVGHLPFSSISHTSGTPLLMPDTSVYLGTPDVTSSSIILTWRLKEIRSTSLASVTDQAPPLVLATYDEFTTDGIWGQSPTTTGKIGATLQSAPDAAMLVATITPKMNLASATLAAFDTSTHIDGAQPLLLGSGTTALHVAGWQSTHPLVAGSAYVDTAAVLSDSDLGAASATTVNLPASELARLLAVPPALVSTLQGLVIRWTSPDMTPLQKADALASGMRTTFTLVEQQQGTSRSGLTLLADLLTTHKGNALTWATLHVLLCRQAGIPSRLASGFTPGTSDVHTGISTVRANDATWMTQLATTAGWIHIGPLDHVETAPVPQIQASGNSGGAPPVTRFPTPPTRGQTVGQPTSHPHGHAPQPGVAANVLLLELLEVLLLILAGALAARHWWLSHTREHGPLVVELRWLLLCLLRAAHRLFSGSGSLTPRQLGEALARHLPDGLAGPVYDLADLYSQLVYGPALSRPDPERQTYRNVTYSAQRVLQRARTQDEGDNLS